MITSTRYVTAEAARAEVTAHLPQLTHEFSNLRSAGIEPTGVLLPERLNVPFPGATDLAATCVGLPITWSPTGQWGVVITIPEPEPPAMRIEPSDSCHVSGVRSLWRNRPHWHTVWPEGSTWCYRTAEEAADRAVEVAEIRALNGLDRYGNQVTSSHTPSMPEEGRHV
jgi:hypothetical protein